MAEKKTQKGGFRKKLLTFATFLSTIIPSAAAAKDAPQQDNDNADKIVTVVPTRKIDYQVDTVSSVDNYGLYSKSKNSITLRYQKIAGAKYNLPEDFIAMCAIHEQKHRDNRVMGICEYPVNPEQAYKLDMHNEISANIAELIYIRDKYIKTGDMRVLDVSSRFDFYKEAVENGRINPQSKYREDFDAEMSLIINGVIKLWDKDIADIYSSQNAGNAFNHSDHAGVYSDFHDENYKKCLSLIYTISGVDFSQYIKEDVIVPVSGKKRLDYMLLQSYLYMKSLPNQEAADFFCLPKYDNRLTLDEYRNLLRHAVVIKHMSIAHNTPQEYLSATAQSYLKQEKTREEISEEYKKSFEIVNKHFKHTIDAMIDRIATDSHNGTIKIPRKTKEKGMYYEQALAKLYTVSIEKDGELLDMNLSEILNPDGKMPLSNVYELSLGTFVKETNNKKVSMINLPEPKYSEWKDVDGERVSEVQYVEVIDTSRGSIVQPETTYMDKVNDNVREYLNSPQFIMALKKGKEH